MIKTAILTLLMSTSLTVAAKSAAPAIKSEPTTVPKDTQQLITALISNPKIVEDLNKAKTVSLANYIIKEAKQGIWEYTMTFGRTCFCTPAEAKVKITEDLTPTYHDGPPTYTATIEIKEKARGQ